MLLYLDLAYEQAEKAETAARLGRELRTAIVQGAAQRIRPKIMTVTAALFGLVPILWATGAGSDVLKRIAAPMIGGLFTSFLLGTDRLSRTLRTVQEEDGESTLTSLAGC